MLSKNCSIEGFFIKQPGLENLANEKVHSQKNNKGLTDQLI